MPPASSPETDPAAWIRKADEDLELARRVLASYAGSADDRLLQGICFHGQQAVEKALKGFLTARQEPFQKNHDIVRLLSQCRQLDAAMNRIDNRVVELMPFVSEARYPNELPLPTYDETTAHLARATACVELVRQAVTPQTAGA